MSVRQIRPNGMAAGGEKDTLTVLALGSGVVVCLYDENLKQGGLVYTLFPDSTVRPEGTEAEPMKYINTGLEQLLDSLEAAGMHRENLWAKLIGGAKIFQFVQKQDNGDIGKKNVEAARKWLFEKKIPIKAEDTGDSFGRTLRFYLETGAVEIEAVNHYKYYL